MKYGRSAVIGSASMSPGSEGATSTQPPFAGAVKVETKNDSPESTERLIPARMPPSALASSVTPAECATMAPLSTRTGSPAASTQRATVDEGLCRSSTFMSRHYRSRVTPAVGRYATAPERPRTTFTEAGARSRRRSVDDHFPALHGEREITAGPRLLRAEGRITPPFVAAEPVPPGPAGHPDLMPDRSAALRVR